jgi:hypothetical protein
MRVSKLVIILCLTFAVGIGLALFPATAGAEHPWNDGLRGTGSGTSGASPTHSDTVVPNTSPTIAPPGGTQPLLGTSLWWWQFLWEGIGIEGSNGPNAPAHKLDSKVHKDKTGGARD